MNYRTPWCTFQSKLEKIRKIHTEKIYSISGNVISLQDSKTFYIYGKVTLQAHIFLLFQEETFRAQKIKKTRRKMFIYFGKWNFLAPSLKNSYISGGNFKVPSLQKIIIFFPYF